MEIDILEKSKELGQRSGSVSLIALQCIVVENSLRFRQDTA